MQPGLDAFEHRIAQKREELLAHPLYPALDDLDAVRVFMGFHAFAVWDFMSLLKRLQQRLTCTTVPWVPCPEAELARLINDIVLGEECDEAPGGGYLSHYELYLQAMREVGADTGPVTDFVQSLPVGSDVLALLADKATAGGVFAFMHTTFAVLERGTHEVAAAFLYGREDIIPAMFQAILQRARLYDDERYRCFRHYLERHIEVDGDSHGPLARHMLRGLCGRSAEKWAEAEAAALEALDARIALWTFVHDHIRAG